MIVRARRLWFTLAASALFVAACACVPLLIHPRRPPDPFRHGDELADHIRATHPELRIIFASKTNDPSEGFYLCSSKRSEMSIRRLCCNPRVADQWYDVVYCRENKTDPDESHLDHELLGWNNGGLRIGRVVIVGDPRMVRQLREGLPH